MPHGYGMKPFIKFLLSAPSRQPLQLSSLQRYQDQASTKNLQQSPIISKVNTLPFHSWTPIRSRLSYQRQEIYIIKRHGPHRQCNANCYSHDQIYHDYSFRLRLHLPWRSWSYRSTLSEACLTRSFPHSNSEACLTRSCPHPIRGLPQEVLSSPNFRGLPHEVSPSPKFRGLPHDVLPSPNPRLASWCLALTQIPRLASWGLILTKIPRLASWGLALIDSKACLTRSCPHHIVFAYYSCTSLFIWSMWISDSYSSTFVYSMQNLSYTVFFHTNFTT